MTEAEKALELLWDALNGFYSECRAEPTDVDKDAHGKIKKELQRAAECEKIRDNYSWVKKEKEALEMENKALKDKTQGLTHALQIAKRDFKNWLTHKDAQEAAIAHIDKAIAAFEADETEGVGL